MYRFVLSRRWLGFALFVILLSTLCIRLGFWQLDRLHQRIAENHVVTSNIDAPPATIDQVEQASADDPDRQVWKEVHVTGTYDSDHQIVLKYQNTNGPGIDVITPLVTSTGRAVLVDRGWMATDNHTQVVTDLPPPPAGEVTVVGWWRMNSTATGQAIRPDSGQVRAVSSTGIAESVDYQLYRGYLNLRKQQPRSEQSLDPEPRPDLGQGPHFFYAMQWYFFAGLAIFGWFYFAWSEAHPERKKHQQRALQRT